MIETDRRAPAAGTALPAGRSSTARRYIRLASWIALSDAAAVEAALLLTRVIRFGFRPVRSDLGTLLVLAPVVWVGVFAAFQLYALSRLSPAEEFRRLFEASGVAVAFKLLITLIRGGRVLDSLAGGWLAVTWAIALVLVLFGRQVWHKRMGRLRARGDLSYRTLIVGSNEEAMRIAHTLRPRVLGFQPVGMVPTGSSSVERNGLPLLGSLAELSEVIQANSIECVFVASSAIDPEDMKRLTKLLRRHPVEVRISANMTEILSSRLTVQPVGDLLALSIRPVRLTGAQAIVKRSFDLAVGSLAVVLCAPIWVAIALLIKATSRGPVLYKQVRVGRDARTFTMYKFRTMIRGAELLLPQLKDRNEASGALFKIKDDPRVTRVGRWLRRFSLDELPQLLNVVKGDMSLVGPRPAPPSEVAEDRDWHRDRLEVRPGLTGLWQAGGRSELSFDEYVRLDVFYIENWSIIYHLFILGKTVPAVLFRKGAF